MPSKNRLIINELLNKYYPNPITDGIRFEALASFITTLFFADQKYNRGWITVGSGDRGVDFVGRLDIGHDSFSNTSIVVLGQSKRYKNSISGERLTRVASRMTRGYIGVVVTLDTFTKQAQEEIKDDRLPIILINGKKVAELLLTYMKNNNKTLAQIVLEHDE
jgi:restriction endonuclease Mrr